MESTALICHEDQHFSLEPVLLPDAGPRQMVVRTRYSGISIGTEFALVRNKISWGPYPLCTGYQAVGIVERVGEDVRGFQPGDKVYYRDNKVMQFPDGRAVSAVAGTHCRHAVIDPDNTHGVALLPDGVSEDVASLFVMPAVGLYGVDMANPRMGDTVVVYGAGLIGLGVVAACAHRGCVVVAVDLDERRLALARDLGADHVVNAATHDPVDEIKKIVPPLAEGSGLADVVFESTGIPECIDRAIALCKPLGKFVWQGNYGEKPVSVRFLPAHGRRLTMFFPCDDGLAPCRRAVLKNMAMGALKWERTITHRVEFSQAPELFDRINKNSAPDVVGAVIRWSD